jgi:hypothetical protein
MGMYESAEILRTEFNEIFKDDIDMRKLWWIIKMMHAARLYCRSNTAFNNFNNMVFKDINAEFREVEKEGNDGKKYKGLFIMLPSGIVEDSNEE